MKYFDQHQLELKTFNFHSIVGFLFGFIDTDTFFGKNNFFAGFFIFDSESVAQLFKYCAFIYFFFTGIRYLKEPVDKSPFRFIFIYFAFFYIVSVIRLLTDGFGLQSLGIYQLRHLLIIYFIVAYFHSFDRQSHIFVGFLSGLVLSILIRSCISLALFIFSTQSQLVFDVPTTAFDGDFLAVTSFVAFVLVFMGIQKSMSNTSRDGRKFFLLSLVPIMVVLGSFRRGIILSTFLIFALTSLAAYYLQGTLRRNFLKLAFMGCVALCIMVGLFIIFFGQDAAIGRITSLATLEAGGYSGSNIVYISDLNALFNITKKTDFLGIGFRNDYGEPRMLEFLMPELGPDIVLHVGFYEIIARMGALGLILQILLFGVLPTLIVRKLKKKLTILQGLIVAFAFSYLIFYGFYVFYPPPYASIKQSTLIGICMGILVHYGGISREISHSG